MELNQLIFPAPSPSYNTQLDGLYYVSKLARPKKVEHKLQLNHVVVKASVLGDSRIIRDGPQIVTLYQHADLINNGMIVFFHGNAEDIGLCRGFASVLSQELQLACICMEYPGYGVYQGDCCSEHMIKDAYTLMEHILQDLQVPQNKLVVIGRSIGSGLAVEVSTKYKQLHALVLLSPFTSLCDVISGLSCRVISQLVKERFRNLEKMGLVQCPTLLIHGKQDQLIPMEHSIRLMNACNGVVDMKLQEGMTHNNFIIQLHITSPIRQFLNKLGDQQQINNKYE